ncbi:MAG: hypothetical protein ABI895_06635 [Deltaproteobacteria bacterium]
MSTELPSFRVVRPLVGVLLTVVLAALVAADRVLHGVRPLGLDPRLWAAIIFPPQIFSFALYRALRGRRAPSSLRAASLAAPARFSSLEFAEVCAFVLSIGYWFLTSEQLDRVLQPGWRVMVGVMLLSIPLLAKLLSERPGG